MGVNCMIPGCTIGHTHVHRDASSFGDPRDERIRTLEDALRPFALQARACECGPDAVCKVHGGDAWPCKYETARRALEGEG